MSASTQTRARVPAGVASGGQFCVSARGEADIELATPAGPGTAPSLTATQRDALRALGETGKQWPTGRGRYAIDYGHDSRYSARTWQALVAAGAARYVTGAPGAGVMPYYESTLTAQRDGDDDTWTVTAPDTVADDAYVAAIVHGHRTRAARAAGATSRAYEPEELAIRRGESVDGVTTFTVQVTAKAAAR